MRNLTKLFGLSHLGYVHIARHISYANKDQNAKSCHGHLLTTRYNIFIQYFDVKHDKYASKPNLMKIRPVQVQASQNP